MDYAAFVTDVGALTAEGATDDKLLEILPAAIEYVEGRIYNDPDFDFLSTRQASNVACTPNSRNITKPTALIALDTINLITPAGANPDDNGSTRVNLRPVSLAAIDAIWSGAAGTTGATGQPQLFAPLTDTAFRLGPVPSAAYVLEFIGPTRPAALSPTNTTTFITANMPELFLAGAMIFLSGWMKNFGAQADQPAQAQSWEQQYDLLKTGPAIVEARRKFAGQAWTSQAPTKVAAPPRT